jgi:predicted Zn finger-like uncharacterized protein
MFSSMLIRCPSCATKFSVPDAALGVKGRNVRCTRCGHQWFQDGSLAREMEAEDDFALDESMLPPAPPRMERDDSPPAFDPFSVSPPTASTLSAPAAAAAARAAAAFDLDLDEEPAPKAGGLSAGAPPLADLSPKRRAATQSRGKSGHAGLWILLVLLLLAASAGGVYYFQDQAIELLPWIEAPLIKIGLRHEKPGAGLELRNAGTPERMVYNDTDILVVRGIIANVSQRPRPIPPMKLMLLDKDKHVVQQKISPPPVTTLAPGGTAGFKIQIERPDPTATEVNVVFVAFDEAPPAPATPAPAAPASQPASPAAAPPQPPHAPTSKP